MRLGMTSVLFMLIAVGNVHAQSQTESFASSLRSFLQDMAKQTTENHSATSKILTSELPTIVEKVASLELTVCNVKNWLTIGPSGQLRDFPEDKDFVSFLQERLREHSQVIDDYVKRAISDLHVSPDNKDVEVSLRELAVKVAANEQSIGTFRNDTSRISQKLDAVRSMVTFNRTVVADLGRAIELAKVSYELQAQTFCSRLDEHNQLLSFQANEIAEMKRRLDQIESGSVLPIKHAVNRPVFTPPLQTGSSFEFSEIVQSRAHFCADAQRIKKCYDFYAEDSSGQRIRYHGDLYRDCTGKVVLLPHTPSN